MPPLLERFAVDNSSEDPHGLGAENDPTEGVLRGPHRWNRVSLATALVVVAAIGAECAVVVQIRRCYEAVPSFASPACPECLFAIHEYVPRL